MAWIPCLFAKQECLEASLLRGRAVFSFKALFRAQWKDVCLPGLHRRVKKNGKKGIRGLYTVAVVLHETPWNVCSRFRFRS